MLGCRKLRLTAAHALIFWIPFGTVSAVHAEVRHDPVITRADDVQWEPGPAYLPGVEMAVLQGNPAETGPFIMRLKFPAFFDYPVHRYPETSGDITVLSGAMGMALGEAFDRYVNSPLPAASHFVIPDAWHFDWTFEETIVEVHGNGPWRVEFLPVVTTADQCGQAPRS